MGEEEQDVDEVDDTPHVGVERPRFYHVVVVVDAVHLDEPWKSY